jgi:WhiB family redox-sensing transcriptional regulator
VITIFNNQPWVAEAACTSVDPEAFFVEKGGSTLPAKRVCAACPAQTRCLQWALDTGERHGIYGGYSENERRHLKRGGLLKDLPKVVERTEKRCAWCRKKFTGEQMYCGVSCSSSGTRHERLERLAEIRDAS